MKKLLRCGVLDDPDGTMGDSDKRGVAQKSQALRPRHCQDEEVPHHSVGSPPGLAMRWLKLADISRGSWGLRGFRLGCCTDDSPVQGPERGKV